MEIGGRPGRKMQAREARGSQQDKPEKNSFTPAKREKFLSHFAATCNTKASARAAGISHATVYAWRRKDQGFARAFEQALEEGYLRLEAEVLRLSVEALSFTADEEAAEEARGKVDVRTALAVLESYRRHAGKRPGEMLVHRADEETVRARLEERLKLFGIIDAQGQLIAPAKRIVPAPPILLIDDCRSADGDEGGEKGK